MPYRIEIELTDLEAKVWSMFIKDPQEWVETLVRHEVWRTSEQVYQEELAKLMADPEVKTIPADRNAIIAMSKRKSIVEVDAEMLAQLTADVLARQGVVEQ